jgi:hypothetical protein
MAIQTAQPVMGGFNGQSNAAKGKGAADASVAAKGASAQTKSGDGDSHQRAADAHRDAAWKHQDAGNGDKAAWHRAQAGVHQEKADSANRAKYFADDQARAAESISKKAEMAGFGKDSSSQADPRSEKQLHEDASEAHKRAADAYKLAGCDREQAYHQAKAESHDSMGGALK